MERLVYTGLSNIESLDKWAKQQSTGKKYVVATIVFGEVMAWHCQKLPLSAHAANDWRLGYWYDGERREWSIERKIRAQNAGQTND